MGGAGHLLITLAATRAWAADLPPPRVADFGAPGWLWWAALLTAVALAGLLLRMIVKARLSAEERKARRRARERGGPGAGA